MDGGNPSCGNVLVRSRRCELSIRMDGFDEKLEDELPRLSWVGDVITCFFACRLIYLFFLIYNIYGWSIV